MNENAPQPPTHIEAFAALEENFRPFYENAPDMFVLVDPKTAMVIHCNQTLATNLGYAKKEIIGKSIFDFYHPDCMEDAKLAFASFVRTGSVHNAELLVQRKDGSTIEVSLNVAAVRDEQGDILYSIFAWRDISERKLIETSLRESEERFDLAVRATSDGIWDWNIVTNEEYYAPRWCEVLGYSHDDPELPHVYDSWASRIHPDDYERVMQAVKAHLETGKVYDVDYRHRHKSGEYRWQNSRGQATFDKEQKPVRMVGCIRDITERKHAEEKLHEYQQRLRSLDSEMTLAEERERRRIAANLHDHTIQELALCRIKMGELQVSPHLPSTPCPLRDEIREIVEIVEKVIKETRSLVFELSPPILYELGFGPAVEWLADRMQDHHGIVCRVRNDDRPKPLDDDVKVFLFQAVRELLNNVATHAKARRVEISLRRENDRIQIHVKDNGVGFDNTSVIRAHASRAGGFGLFSIRERLSFFAGQLAIESAPGRGTRITLEAPLRG